MAHCNRTTRRIANTGAEPDAAEFLDKPFDARTVFRGARPFGRRGTETAHRNDPLDHLINPAIDMPDHRVEMRSDAGWSQPPTSSSRPWRCQPVVSQPFE